MPGVMGLDSASLSLLFGSFGTTATGGDPATAVAALKRATAKGAEAKGVAQQQKDPVTLIAVKQFKAAVAHAKDLTAALRDPRVLNVLLPALGLADQVAYPGLAQKALVADPKDKKGILSTLTDTRWKTAATTLDLKTKGLAALQDPATQASLISKFTGFQYHKSLDADQPGISDALYFLDNAAANAGNVYNVLGNTVLRRVVTGALGLPREIAVQSVETQAKAITTRLDLAKLKDPKQVEKLAERYIMAAAGTATGSTDPVLSLFA
jgi:hypothetical protein